MLRDNIFGNIKGQAQRAGFFGNVNLNKPLLQDQVKRVPLFGDRTLISNPVQRENIVYKTKEEIESGYQKFVPLYSKISLFSSEDQRNFVHLNISNSNLVGQGSINDTRMGPTINGIVAGGDRINSRCDDCSFLNCQGHSSYIDFHQWVYNPITIKDVISILSCVCNSCGDFLISDDVYYAQGFNKLSQKKALKKMADYCKQGKILCFRGDDGKSERCIANPVYISSQAKTNGIISIRISNKIDKRLVRAEAKLTLSPESAATILSSISDFGAKRLKFSAGIKPIVLMLRGMLCPPNVIRPLTMSDGKPKNNTLTTLIHDIIRKVESNDAKPQDIYILLYRLIFRQKQQHSSAKPRAGEEITIINTIQGKQGHVRSSMSGKRNNNAGRTVANPHDPLDFSEVGLPIKWNSTLVKNVKIQLHNIEYLYSLLEKGQINTVIDQQTRKKTRPNRNTILKVGDYVERWLQDGDSVCDNRQPTLHRYSFLQYTVKFVEAQTHCNHSAVLALKNCDYDGDENNTWVIQYTEPEAEAEQIVSVVENEISTGKNCPGVGLVLHGIVGSYILTGKDVIIYDELFEELLRIIKYNDQLSTLYSRLAKYGVNPRSGRALLSALFPEDFDYKFKDFEIKEGIVLNPIERNGSIEASRANKKIMGAENRSIIQELHKFYGNEGKYYIQRFLSDAPRVIGRFMDEYGFTIGLKDCVFIGEKDGVEFDAAEELIKPMIAEIEIELISIGGPKTDPLEEEFRKLRINETVDKAKAAGEALVQKLYTVDNNFAVACAIKIGSIEYGSMAKGNTGNLGQMGASAAEQFVSGDRPEPQMSEGTRSSCCRDPGDQSASANGYVKESYMKGSTPEGHWFIMKATREGLLNTANKTSEMGTIAKRMGKVQENKIIGHDFSVRNTIGNMLAPVHNGGYKTDAMIMLNSATGQTGFIDVAVVADHLNRERGFIRKELNIGIVAGLDAYSKMENKNDKILGDFPDFSTFKPKPSKFINLDIPNVNTRLGRFERSRVIQTRAEQINEGRPPRIDTTDMTKASKIAEAEYRQGLLDDMMIVRTYSDNSNEMVPASLDYIWA